MENRIYHDLNSSAYGNYQAYSGSGLDLPKNQSVHLIGDSVMFINTRILANEVADRYLVVMALHQEEATVKACNLEINKRIDAFKKDLLTLQIKEDEIYVDLITFNKIYDYKTTGNTSTQYQSGFELKKNIIVSISDLQLLEEILMLATEQEIYDFVKVDYIFSEKSKQYKKMLKMGEEIIKQKKDNYLAMTHFKLDTSYLVS
ncbi:MAG: hypothetical protein MRY83_13365, partial [Flavobacteriales bacterium]|nr:hypothetical protein [Flavobacteriales bacterium]